MEETLSWREKFESVRVRRDLEKAAYANRSHDGHKEIFIHRRCRGGASQFWRACDDCRIYLSSNPVRRSQVPNWKDIPAMTPGQIEKYKQPGISPRVDIAKRYQEMWWGLYSEYITSPEWRAKRAATFERDSGACQSCGGPAEQAHHMTYERIGDELLEDLISVCRRCHRLAHD